MSEPEFNPAAGSTTMAALLAGGRSRRFGSDKARVLFDGTPLIRRNHRLLSAVFPRVVVVGPPADTYADLGLACVSDDTPHRGPMAGVIAALRERLTTLGPGPVAVCACDTLLTPKAAEELDIMAAALAVRGRSLLAAAGYDEHRWQPLYAVYHTRALPSLETTLATGDRSLTRWLDVPDNDTLRAMELPNLATFNTPEELAQLDP